MEDSILRGYSEIGPYYLEVHINSNECKFTNILYIYMSIHVYPAEIAHI